MTKEKALKTVANMDLKALKAKQAKYEASFQEIPKTDPWVPILLGRDATKYKFELSFRAVREILRETGLNINGGELTTDKLADNEILIKVLLAGLRTHQDIDEDELVGLLTMKHRLYYTQVISKAIEATQPDTSDLQEMLEDMKAALEANSDGELEAGDTTAPLPEIVSSPISGEPAEI